MSIIVSTTAHNAMDQEPAFSLFTKLPPELQDKIWATAVVAADARNVDLIYKPAHESHIRNPFTGGRLGYFTALAPIPTLLHVCRQSRMQATQRWKLRFKDSTWSHRMVQPCRVYVDLEEDTVVVGRQVDIKGVEKLAGAHMVKKVAIMLSGPPCTWFGRPALFHEDQQWKNVISDAFPFAHTLFLEFASPRVEEEAEGWEWRNGRLQIASRET